MKAAICDRCHALGKFVQAKWALPLMDRIAGRVTGDLCEDHLKEAQSKFKPADVMVYREWLLGKDLPQAKAQ